jgi:hypothetical protein
MSRNIHIPGLGKFQRHPLGDLPADCSQEVAWELVERDPPTRSPAGYVVPLTIYGLGLLTGTIVSAMSQSLFVG